MALVKCKECGKEISTDAISCPSCGASQSRKRKSFFKKLWIWGGALLTLIVGLWIAYGYYYAGGGSSIDGLPACNSDMARDSFIKVFNDSQYAREQDLSVVLVSNQSQISYDTTKGTLVCQATLELNNTRKQIWKFVFIPTSKGAFTFVIHGQEIDEASNNNSNQ